jgi:hypothetical protein
MATASFKSASAVAVLPEARKYPGPGAYYHQTHVEHRAATHSVFLSRVPRNLGLEIITAAPGPTKYQRPVVWGEGGRAHAIGPRAKLRLARDTGRHGGSQRYVDMEPSAATSVRWTRQGAPPSIPDGTWKGLGAWQHRAEHLDRSRSPSLGPGQYSPRFDAIHRRTTAVHFGRATTASALGARGASRDQRQWAFGSDRKIGPALSIEPSTPAVVRYPTPTFKRQPVRPGTVPFASRSPAHGLYADGQLGGAAVGLQQARHAPGPLSYDTRPKLSQPLPPFP